MSISSSIDGQSLPGKLSSDSGQNNALDRWSQRRLQRLNTEQGFREQRQGGHGVLHSPASYNESYTTSTMGGAGSLNQGNYGVNVPQSSRSIEGSHQPTYQGPRTGQLTQQPATGFAFHAPPTQSHDTSTYATTAQSQPLQSHPPQQQQTQLSTNSAASTPDSTQATTTARTSSQQPRHVAHQLMQPAPAYTGAEDASMSTPHNANSANLKAARIVPGTRSSMHNGNAARDPTQSNTGMPAGNHGPSGFNNPSTPQSNQPPNGAATNGPSNGPNGKGTPNQSDVGRATPLSAPSAEDMSPEDVAQLIKDHKELREYGGWLYYRAKLIQIPGEKYTKVKKYYFEKEDQVKQLQNSIAHQRLSQSRTSLDDSEYCTRFSRLDGLVAQLAFSIRKSWKTIPGWLHGSVNKDAVVTGRQEMTAVGRAIISSWIVEECFKRYFHPDLDPNLSIELKRIQQSIRYSAPQPHSADEEEALTSKIINWRLTTLDGLQESLRSSQSAANRASLTDTLKQGLIRLLSGHLQDPPPSDLEGGVHMIVELIVSIAVHLPMESRDVVIEYFVPGLPIMHDQMKLESGIPSLGMSFADDQTERMSAGSMTSEATDMVESAEIPKKKRSMLSALTGTGKGKPTVTPGMKHAGAAGSTVSLGRPESTHGEKESRVRMAAGIGVQIRGRSVLVKAPIFST